MSSPAFFSEDTRISVKLLLGVLGLIVLPMVGGGLHVIRALDGIKAEVTLLRGDMARQGEAVQGAVSTHDFRAYLREARAAGYPDLPPFLTD